MRFCISQGAVMVSVFSDLHVRTLARGLMDPGEQLVARTACVYAPWWSLGLRKRLYLALATNRRLLLLDHRLSWFHSAMRLHHIESIAWSEVKALTLGGFFSKTLTLNARTETEPLQLKLKVLNTLFGLLMPMRNNLTGAEAVVRAFEHGRFGNELASTAHPQRLLLEHAS
jgi:hypothetical protein